MGSEGHDILLAAGDENMLTALGELVVAEHIGIGHIARTAETELGTGSVGLDTLTVVEEVAVERELPCAVDGEAGTVLPREPAGGETADMVALQDVQADAVGLPVGGLIL